MTQLEKLKIKIGGNEENDGYLSLLLDGAEGFIHGYTGRSAEEWLPVFDAAAVEIAVIDYNKAGAEGLSSRTEGAVSSAFHPAVYPESILGMLRNYRLAVVV